MTLAAMSSFLVSYRETAAVGLASQTTDCEWSSEIDHAGGVAYSARVSLAHGAVFTLDPAALMPGAAGLRVIAVKAVEGDVEVSCNRIEAMLPEGASSCWSSSTPADPTTIALSTTGQSATADVVLIAASGS